MKSLTKTFLLSFILVALLVTFTSARRSNQANTKRKPLPLSSVHLIDRNGFAETISAKDRLEQFQKINFLEPQPYQKVLRIYARDSQGNVRSIVTSYYPNGNTKQLLEILNGRALGSYREWHENGNPSLLAKVIGGNADITMAAENSWLFDGVTQVWDEDKHLTAEIPYSQGVLEGLSIYYHPNGQVWKRIPYRKGQVDGTIEIYRDTGELLQQMAHVQGQRHGTSTRYWGLNQLASQEEYSQGKLENGQYFDNKGTLITEVKQGTGYRAIFGKDSVSELQEYQYGILEGEVKVFDPNGTLKRIYHVKNNIKHGEEIEYYPSLVSCEANPQPKLSFYWYEGAVQGHVKTWYPNGNVESQKEMANNKKNGVSTIWYRDGNLMMIEEYEQDKLVRGDYFKKGEKIPTSQVIQGKGTATIFDANGHFVQKIAYANGKPDEL